MATQLALLAVIGLLANNYFAFYSSWDDLLGSGDDGPVEIRTKLDAGHDGRVEPLGRVPVKGGGAVGREPGQAGEIQQVRIPGATTGLSTEGYVYLPPQYFRPEYAHRTFPVVIVTTGFPGDARNLVTRLNYPGAALRLLQSGRMQPTVLVMMFVAA